ncbi:MAG: DNA methyltransferase [Alphaproteobacteria bacterium]|nr:DNA methyltransferase [Alphaproteobacteria bacterium]
MKKIDAEDALAKSADVVATNVDQLKVLFPEAVKEGKIDFDVLKQLLGGTIDEREERYGLNWHGKRRARQLALTPSTGTLRPCPEESVDWDTTQNLMIEGDNLEVLKLLQKSYAGKVKLIYIDPPYNTGKDFVYPDDFRDNIRNYLELTGQIEGDKRISSNTDASGRFHTDWLNMMYPRLRLARALLKSDGVIFISIDNVEYANLAAMCNEIYGAENVLGTVVWKNATDNNPTNVATEHEYILAIAKDRNAIEKEWKSKVSDVKDVLVRVGTELAARHSGDRLTAEYESWFREHKSELWPLDRYKYIDKGGVYTGSQSVHNPGKEGYRYDVIHPATKKPCKQPLMGYRFPKETMDTLLAEGRILFGDDHDKIVELKVYAHEYEEKLSSLLELDGRLGAYDLREDFPEQVKVFSNPKPVRLFTSFFPFVLKQTGDIMLDFFAGSGASARAVMQLNSADNVQRRFILVQLPEPLSVDDKEQRGAAQLCDALNRPRNIAELTKERLRRAGARLKSANPLFAGDLGFRTFQLNTSNIRAWDPRRDDIASTLDESVEHLKTDRTEKDILAELLLKLGLELTVPLEEKKIAGKTVYNIGAGTLMACLNTKISAKDVEKLAHGIADWHKELAPAGETVVVFRDSAFADDVAKTNLTAILAQAREDRPMIVRSL